MLPKLKSVEPLPNYRLLLTFDNGEQRQFDMNSYLDKGIFADLKDEALFRAVHVSFDTIEWPNGADLCPEVLYEQSSPLQSCATEVK
jgi:hypothetical protein